MELSTTPSARGLRCVQDQAVSEPRASGSSFIVFGAHCLWGHSRLFSQAFAPAPVFPEMAGARGGEAEAGLRHLHSWGSSQSLTQKSFLGAWLLSRCLGCGHCTHQPASIWPFSQQMVLSICPCWELGVWQEEDREGPCPQWNSQGGGQPLSKETKS